MPGLLVAGTSSDAGKSLVTAGLCRALARRGVRVAPFKAQNMSSNSMVVDGPAEIGRAQWLQARAARVSPTAAMNPVLLKPATDRRAYVVLRGRSYGTLEAGQYAHGRTALVQAAFESYEELAAAYDLVVCEGAGSPAEINLRAGDYVNMGLARRFGIPVALVGDIDRGGMLAAVYGTQAILDPEDAALLAGFVVNKFRGDVSVLEPGLATLTARTGLPCLGIVPWLPGVWLDSEDTLHVTLTDARDEDLPRLSVAVVRLPRVSNATDVDALGAEAGVDVVVSARGDVLAAADLVVVPGSRSTAEDLAWLRRLGLDRVLARRAATGRPILGICGGYQLLGRTITDPHGVEAAPGTVVEGLGLLPVRTTFATDKTLGRPIGSWRSHEVTGYEIHHGVAEVDAAADAFLDGVRVGSVFGTMWHGILENDGFRLALLSEVASLTGATWLPSPGGRGFDERREAMIEALADAVERYAPDLVDLAAAQR